MNALKFKRPAAEISRLPGHALMHELSAFIRAEIERSIQAAGVGSAAPTFAEYRARSGYTVAELAQLAGVSKSYVAQLQRCSVKDPNFEILNKLARALGVEASLFRSHVVAEIQREHRRAKA